MFRPSHVSPDTLNSDATKSEIWWKLYYYLMEGTPAGSETTGVNAGVICRLSPDFNDFNFLLVLEIDAETSLTIFLISLIF